MINLDDVNSYLAQAKSFFVELEDFLEFRVSGLAKGAQGDSRYISQWVGMVGQENTQAVIAKLAQYEQLLANQGPSMLSKFIFWGQSLFNTQDTKVNQAFRDLQRERLCKEVTAKITEHLLRAQEFLKEVDFNSGSSAIFLPVQAHKDLAVRAKKAFEHCNKVIADNQPLTDKTIPRTRKSWFTNILRAGSYLVATRVAAYGLKDTSPFPQMKMSETDIKNNNEAARKQLKEISTKWDKLQSVMNRPSKTTRKLLGSDTAGQRPDNTSLHFQYVPEEVVTAMNKFNHMMGKTAIDKVTAEQVFEVSETPFPKPTRNYR